MSISRLESYTKWQAWFERLLADDNDRVRDIHAQCAADARALHPLRHARPDLTFQDLTACDPRDPVVCVLKTPVGELKVVVVHSPGPGAKAELKATKEA